MTERKAKGTTKAAAEPADGFTAEERAAMKERAAEVRASKRGAATRAKGEAEVQAKIAEMPEPDRTMAAKVHAVVLAAAPDLVPRLWYGMPAYAKGGKVVCFFQNAQKFKTCYSTLGFDQQAHLDDGVMWPTAFALTDLTPAEEARIADLVRRAVG